MEFFPDRAHVRLKSRVRGTFLHADEDGWGVSLSARRESPNTAWVVHRVVRDGVAYVLLHSAAYARHLAVSPIRAPPGHRGRRAVQNIYGHPQQDDIAWEATKVGDHVVRIRHVSDRFLRANGRYRLWHNDVSVDTVNNQSTMMHWKVKAIAPRSAPPELPLPTPFPDMLERTIVYVQADNLEYHDPKAVRLLFFTGRSVSQLRTAVATELQVGPLATTLCLQAGNHGRFIPLITNLPRDELPLFIVVLTTGSPAAQALVYPC